MAAPTAADEGQNVPVLQEQNTPIPTLNVGSRKSKLALIQTEMVVNALAAKHPDHKFAVRARDTAAGDIDKVTPFKDMAVKNIWTHELETLMLEGQLDFLVHSLKDVPTQLPPNCEIGAVLEREDPRDAFILKTGRQTCKISELPPGSVIGTSSIRRSAQIALKYPQFQIKDVRGNVPTRLSKLDAEDGPFDALILASAGLIRLDLGHRITQYLDSQNGGMLYAVGQGAIGIESRSDDVNTKDLLASVNHVRTFLTITVERSLLRTIEGGCSAPLGVETAWDSNAHDKFGLRLKAIVVSTDGKESVEVDLHETVDTVEAAIAFGADAAQGLLEKGADKILAEIQAKKPTTAADLLET